MAESKLLLSVTLVEEAGEDGGVHVMLGIRDGHLQSCPVCLAMYALRISGALCDAVEQMKRGDNEAPAAGSGAQHHLH